jgi:hypothetical protein
VPDPADADLGWHFREQVAVEAAGPSGNLTESLAIDDSGRAQLVEQPMRHNLRPALGAFAYTSTWRYRLPRLMVTSPLSTLLCVAVEDPPAGPSKRR